MCKTPFRLLVFKYMFLSVSSMYMTHYKVFKQNGQYFLLRFCVQINALFGKKVYIFIKSFHSCALLFQMPPFLHGQT